MRTVDGAEPRFNEPEWEDVLDEAVRWMGKHLVIDRIEEDENP